MELHYGRQGFRPSCAQEQDDLMQISSRFCFEDRS